jgi:hypothetical protein
VREVRGGGCTRPPLVHCALTTATLASGLDARRLQAARERTTVGHQRPAKVVRLAADWASDRTPAGWGRERQVADARHSAQRP